MEVFISYSSGESILAAEIKHVLEKAGAKAWFAEKSLMAGEKFPKEIMDAIMKCERMVVIISKSSDASGQVENEIVNFNQKEEAKIIPYMIDNKQEKTALHLSTYHWINATQDPYDKYDELIATVFDKDLLEEDETPKAVLDGPHHEVDNVNAIKPFKKAAGKIAFFLIAAQLLLISFYLAMNISTYYLIFFGAVLFAAIFYPLRQIGRCAFTGCSNKSTPEKTQVICQKNNKIKMFGLCNRHKHTLDMETSKKSNMKFLYIAVILFAALMGIGIVKYDITPLSLMTMSSSDYTQNDFETAQDMGKSVCALDKNTACVLKGGTVYIYDGNKYGDDIAQWDGVIALSARSTHITALRFDGKVLVAGENRFGECDIGSLNVDDIISVEAGEHFTVILTKDGHVYGIGRNDEGQIDLSGTVGITQVSAGADHTLALKEDGTVAACGNNDYGQCDISAWTDIVAVSAGRNLSVGLKSDGTIVTTAGEVPWTGIVAISAGDSLVAGLTKNGNVLLAGEEDYIIGEAAQWENIVAVDVFGTHIVGIRADSTLVDASLSGKNYTDEDIDDAGTALNNDASVQQYMNELAVSESFSLTLEDDMMQGGGSIPDFEFVGFDDIAQIKANSTMAVGLKSNGEVVVNRVDGSADFSLSDWDGIIMIDVSANHAVGITSGHTLVAAGDNSYGQLDVSDLKGVVYVSVADTNTVGILQDGSVVAVGDNSFGQCDVYGWSEVKLVDSGAYHTVGVRCDGTVVATGRNDEGQCDVASWSDIASVAVGDGFTIGLKRDGSVVTAGDIDISGFDIQHNIVAVDAAGAAYVMLREDGALYDAHIS